MKKTTQKKTFAVLQERLDFINVLGDSSHINHSSEIGFQKLKDYFNVTHGFDYDRRKRDVLFFSPKGSRTIIVEFTRNRQNSSPIIKVKFTGSFLYGCQREREGEIRNFIERVWNDLGIESLPYSNEFDIAIDTLGASFEEIGIDLNSNKWKLINKKNARFKYSSQPFHNNPNDLSEKTGQVVEATRFKFRWYDRILAMEQKYKKEEYQEYCAYYYELYDSFNRVLREEVKLKKELCSLFNVLFWGSKKSFDITLPACLSLFIKSHQFINTKTGKPNKRMEENFYLKENTSLRKTQMNLGEEGSPLYTLKYNPPKYNKKILAQKLALAHLAEKGRVVKSMDELFVHVEENMDFILDEQIKNLTKNYQTNLLLSQGDMDKKAKIVAKYILEKNKLLEAKKELQEEFKAKRSKS